MCTAVFNMEIIFFKSISFDYSLVQKLNFICILTFIQVLHLLFVCFPKTHSTVVVVPSFLCPHKAAHVRVESSCWRGVLLYLDLSGSIPYHPCPTMC